MFNISQLLCRQWKRKASSKDIRPDAKGNARLWYLRLGYLRPISLYYLGINALGVKL